MCTQQQGNPYTTATIKGLEKQVESREKDLEILILRLTGEDKNTHSPETLEVLDRWEHVVCAKFGITK